MLKLERGTKNRDVSIRLQARGKLFNKSFLKAFAIAAAFHGIGLTLFHVSPFKISNEVKILAPVSVKTDLGLITNGSVQTLITDSESPSSSLSFLKPSKPKLQKIPHSSLKKPFLYERIEAPKQGGTIP